MIVLPTQFTDSYQSCSIVMAHCVSEPMIYAGQRFTSSDVKPDLWKAKKKNMQRIMKFNPFLITHPIPRPHRRNHTGFLFSQKLSGSWSGSLLFLGISQGTGDYRDSRLPN